jgi:hypothetical protein
VGAGNSPAPFFSVSTTARVETDAFVPQATQSGRLAHGRMRAAT